MIKWFNQTVRILSYFLVLSLTLIESSCGRDSSPEGRMSLKLESLQKELIDSLRHQNSTMLDSLSKIRVEIEALKDTKK